EPLNAEDALFKGLVINEVEDPLEGLQLIEGSIKHSRRTPLAQLALAEASVLRALDTGNEKDVRAAVQAAEGARALLDTSTHSLSAGIQSQLLLWDFLNDHKQATEAARCLKTVSRLVEGEARGRYSDKLRIGCQYYHDRQRTGLKSAKALWEYHLAPAA